MGASARIVKAGIGNQGGSNVIALSGQGVGAFTSAAGLVLATAGLYSIEWGSLCANVSSALTTSSLAVLPQWQGSNNGTMWVTINPMNNAAYVALAAGTGSLVTTVTVISAAGINPSTFPYLRFAVLGSVGTGAAGDNVTVTYNWQRRLTLSG